MNSWEAVLHGVKAEYLGLHSNIQGLEIYSLRPQVSINNPLKNRKECQGRLAHRLQLSNEVPREQSFRGWTVGR